ERTGRAIVAELPTNARKRVGRTVQRLRQPLAGTIPLARSAKPTQAINCASTIAIARAGSRHAVAPALIPTPLVKHWQLRPVCGRLPQRETWNRHADQCRTFAAGSAVCHYLLRANGACRRQGLVRHQ